jgi:Zn-finger nucleic acid-binding protein
MNCPSCGAPMRLKPDMVSFKCEYCQNAFVPTADDEGVCVLGETCAQDCPLCSIPLEHATIAKTRMRYCTKCHGMLIPMDILPSLIEDLRAGQTGTIIPPAADSSELQRKINCPQCHHRMETHFYAGPGHVIVDSCENCSELWFDSGELMRIVRASGDESSIHNIPPVPMPGDDGWIGNSGTNSTSDIVSDTIIDVIGRSILG